MENKRILFIEICNYTDYPLGGHLSFAKHVLSAFGSQLALVGCSTDDTPIGCWTKKTFDGIEYDFFSVRKVSVRSSKKPLVPGRLTHFFSVLKHRKKIFEYPAENILIQTPEVLFSTQKYWKKKNTAMVFAGLENPLLISRYKYAKFFSALYATCLYRIASRLSCIFACADTQSITTFVQDSKGLVVAENVSQLPTRVDTSLFYHSPDKMKSRRVLKMPEKDMTVIVTSGRLHWAKGWKFMIDSFRLFLNIEKDAHLFFLGDGEEKNEICSYIKDNNLSSNVSLSGRVSHDVLAEYLRAADLFIMGSYVEGFSTSLVEAVVSGIPTCVTTFSSATDLIQEGYNGYVCPCRDEKEFVKYMRKAILIPEYMLKESSANAKTLYAIKTLKQDMLNHWKLE